MPGVSWVMRGSFLLMGIGSCLLSLSALDDVEQLSVGLQKDGRIVVPTNQVLNPAGKQVTFPGRPVDLALAENGAVLVVKNMRDLLFVDTATGQIKQTLTTPREGGRNREVPGFSVVGLMVREGQIYAPAAETCPHRPPG